MGEQEKLRRLLRFIDLLKSKRRRTAKEYAEELEVNVKTIYRYIEMLDGFNSNTWIDKDEFHQYFICNEQDDEGYIFHFNTEEVAVLHQLVRALGKKHPMHDALCNKLHIPPKSDNGDDLFNNRISNILDGIGYAMQGRKRVILKNYHSTNNGQSVSDRLIEPFQMIDFYYVVGYELKSGICKQFAIDRIGTVDVLDEKFEYENAHQKIKTDAFGMSQGETFDVALKLSKRAHLLLRRHHPRTIPKINIDHQNEQYIYCDKIKGLEGVGKFVMGLLNDVQVLQPPELKAYIDEQLEKYQSQVNH